MKLFDDISRDYTEPAKYAEPKFGYYNRSARQDIDKIRQLIETWFIHYPVEHQKELYTKFRSSIDSQHYSAFFELFIHELLLQLGYSIIVHPDISGTERKPDFLATALGSTPFYIEATLATDKSADEIAKNARMNEVYDALNRMDSPNFFIEMEIIGAPKSPPSAKKIRSFLVKQLRVLDPDKIVSLWQVGGKEGVPHWRYEHDGWIVDFYPIPKSPKARGRPGSRPIGVLADGEVHVLNSHDAIRDTIISKANRYGEIDLPYVIAVNALGEHVENIDIMNALFGQEQIVVNFGWGPKDYKETRADNGAWRGPSGIQYTRVSAILIAHPLFPYNIPTAPIRLYHNPWAKRKYTSQLTQLPQAVPEHSTGNTMTMPHKEGKSLAEIFNLSPEWPK